MPFMNKKFSKKSKLKLNKSVIVTYASKTWVLRNKSKKRLKGKPTEGSVGLLLTLREEGQKTKK